MNIMNGENRYIKI